MSDKQFHPSMRFHGFVGRKLVSRNIALAVAEMIFAEVYGEAEVRTQQPFSVTDMSDRWVVEGRSSYSKDSEVDDNLRDGRLVIEILKENCEVVKLIQMAHLLPHSPG